MREELLAYLLNDVDPEQRKRIEQRLESDPIWQHELERLESCLEAYDADPETSCPPTDLVHRTCSFVQHASVNADCPPIQNDATFSESRERKSGGNRWSLADLIVGAAALLVIAMLCLPALRESRDAARQAKCQDNLQRLGTALVEYAERNQRGLPHIELGESAGTFVLDLAEAGILSPEQLAELVVCPSSNLARDVFDGRVVVRVPSRKELENAPQNALATMLRLMSGEYAYRLGYQDEHGEYRQVRFDGSRNSPMLADAPSFSVAGFQSANHGGCGQNVLFQDLSCRYLKQCVATDNSDHLFLNADNEEAAGRHERDIVLVRSEVGPEGPIVRVGR